MLERDGYNGPIAYHCDLCSESEETHCTDFASAWAKAKMHGWRALKKGEEWQHKCPSCAE